MKRSSVLGGVTSLPPDRRELSGFLAMKIPVFISCPTSLSPSQEAARTVIIRQLDDNDLEVRALGRSDYPSELALREVLLIARSLLGWDNSGFRAVPRERWIEKARNSCRRAGQHINSISDSLEPFGVRHSFRASSPDPGVPRRRHHRRYIRSRRFRCFHSSYAATTHQRCCKGCSEAGISEMGGQGSRALL